MAALRWGVDRGMKCQAQRERLQDKLRRAAKGTGGNSAPFRKQHLSWDLTDRKNWAFWKRRQLDRVAHPRRSTLAFKSRKGLGPLKGADSGLSLDGWVKGNDPPRVRGRRAEEGPAPSSYWFFQCGVVCSLTSILTCFLSFSKSPWVSGPSIKIR